MRRSKITVIIPHFGEPHPTDALVASLLAQSLDGDLQIIVVDDASPHPYRGSEGVYVHRREQNGGFGAAVNSGASIAKYGLLLILNSDVQIDGGFVQGMLTATRAHPSAMIAPRILKQNGSPEYNARRFPHMYHYVVEWLVSLSRLRHSDLWHRAVGHDLRSRLTATVRVDWVTGAAFIIPQSLFLGVGGFDERFHMNCEEVDLQWRLAKVGVPVIFVGKIYCSHEGGASSRHTVQQSHPLWSARFLYARKWGGAARLWRLRLVLAAATAVNFAWRCGRWLLRRPGRPLSETMDEIAVLRLSV